MYDCGRLILPGWMHTILAPGVLGGLSTFSAPIVDIVDDTKTTWASSNVNF